MHSPAGREALGAAGQREWIESTHDVKGLPERAGKGSTMAKPPAFGPTKGGQAAVGKPKPKAPSKNAPPRAPRSAGFGSPMMGTMSAPPAPPPGPGMAGLAGGGPMPPPRPAGPPPMPPIATSAMVPPPTPGIGGAGKVGRGGASKKDRAKKDQAYDRAHGIEEDSSKDKKMDKALGISEKDEIGKGGGNWIAGATKNKGGLHRSLGIPEGKKIPKSKLSVKAGDSAKVKKEKNLAKTLEGMHGKGGDYNSQRNTKIGRGHDFNSSLGKGGSGAVHRLGNRSGSGRVPAGGR